ncbi:hypothetical protein CONLIGDRAFT_139139 [Coniochaeta ligniaria NRRL 30616]|uniref:Uncharacterized protein n=1 Tax=Coniochaeta ligniaria NRRL 30616 TaxID=1408157 RepID=A0A1J7I8B0_9PEZI|nr:hypothetical protein CONLIGDRAFT_139139 [Coniochaeta ligniaria NRRL 30616]
MRWMPIPTPPSQPHRHRYLRCRDLASVGLIPLLHPHSRLHVPPHTPSNKLRHSILPYLSLTSTRTDFRLRLHPHRLPGVPISPQPVQGTYFLRHPSTCISLHAPRDSVSAIPVISQIAGPLLPSCLGPGHPPVLDEAVLDDGDLPGCQTYKAAMPSLLPFRVMSRYPSDVVLYTELYYSFPSFPFLFPKSLSLGLVLSLVLLVCLEYFLLFSHLASLSIH